MVLNPIKFTNTISATASNDDYQWRRRYTGVSYSPDSSKISYTSTKRTGQYSDLYIYDLENQVETPLHIVDEVGWSFVAWHPSAEKALIRKYISVAESHLFEIDFKTGEKNGCWNSTVKYRLVV